MSPIADERSIDLISHSAEQTHRLGTHLGSLAQAGDIFCLAGDLGVGKTCLVQGIGKGLGVAGPINSPSFTLVNEYSSATSRLTFYHIDLYRLEDTEAEGAAIGLEDYLYSEGICAIEWADKAWAMMPAEHMAIEMRYIDPHKRGLLLRASGARYRDLVIAFKARVFGGNPKS